MAKRRKHKKHHSRKRRGMHGFGSSDQMMEILGGAGGALASTMVAKINVPGITDPKLVSAAPAAVQVAAGIAAAHFGKKTKAIHTGGIVLASIGAANLLKQFVPGLAGICGDGPLQGDVWVESPEAVSGPLQEEVATEY